MKTKSAHNELLKAPFPYFGGKVRAASLIWSRFGEVVNYVEPFAGSLAVLLQRPQPFSGSETVNDLDGMLANFWRALKHAPEAVAEHADWPVNECIPAGTMIATPDGSIPVEDVRPGMLVLGERNGRVIPTRVRAVKQDRASEFYQVGTLRVTGNHPLWTAEYGYQKASDLKAGIHVAKINWPVSKTELVMLYCSHEQATLGDLHIERSSLESGTVCGSHVSREATLQRAYVASGNGRENASRLLDSITCSSRFETLISSYRTGARGWLAGCRATMDRVLPSMRRFGQLYGWWRWDTRLCANTGTPTAMVGDALGRALSARTRLRNEGAAPYFRSPREDQPVEQGAQTYRRFACKTIQGAQGQDAFRRTQGETLSGPSRQAPNFRAQTENRSINHEPQAGTLCGDGTNLCVSHGDGAGPWSDRGVGQSSNSQGLPLQRVSLPLPVTVYNFETETHNYFANQILVHNCDLHARHIWLVNQRADLTRRLEGDPDYYDAKIAGYWVWGIACWIGSGWCSGDGPWQLVEDAAGVRQLVHLGDQGQGVHRQRVHLGDQGRGVHRQLVHLGNQGQGVHRKRVHLGNQGRGVHRKRVHLGGAWSVGQGIIPQRAYLLEYFTVLADRLRNVRVCCGDWTRVLGPSVTHKHGLTAILLDPPYSNEERAAGLYTEDCGSVAARCREWALENGANPLLRIALCGYAGEHEMPASWECVAWHARGGYDGQNRDRDNQNRQRERIWFSPHCLKETLPLFTPALLAQNSESSAGVLFE